MHHVVNIIPFLPGHVGSLSNMEPQTTVYTDWRKKLQCQKQTQRENMCMPQIKGIPLRNFFMMVFFFFQHKSQVSDT